MSDPVATGTVYRSSGSFWITFKLPGSPRRRRKLGEIWPLLTDPPAGMHNEASARRELDAILAPYAGWAPDWELTLDVAARAWIDAGARAGTIRMTSARRYEQVLERHLAPLGMKTVGSITEREVRSLRGVLAAKTGPSTLNQSRAVLSGAVRHLRDVNGYRGPDPSSWWAYATPAAPRHVDVYSPEEVERLVAAAGNPRDAALYRTAAYAGLRIGELRALRWGDVDLDASRIIVHAGFTNAGGEGPTKNGLERAVPIVPQLAAGLILLRGDASDEDRVFTEAQGGVLDDDRARARLRAACDRAGIRRLGLHGLRHSAASMLIQVFPIHEVQSLLGHASIVTTSRYLHMKIGDEHASKMGAWIEERTGGST